MGNPLPTLYKKLVNSGKINEAEKLLEKLFLEKSGTKLLNEQNLPLKVYHGTEKSFNSFDLSRIGSANDPGFYGRGFYFSPNKTYAETYGPLREFFVKMNSPFKAFTPETSKASLLFNQKDDSFNFMVDEAIINKFKEDLLKSDGVWHNSIAPIRDDNKIIQEIVVPTPNQIKSSKVTFDDEGNLIPLDLRYDFSNPDFRFKDGGVLKFQNSGKIIKRLPGYIRYGVPATDRGDAKLAKKFIKDFKTQKEIIRNKFQEQYDRMSVPGPVTPQPVRVLEIAPKEIFNLMTIPGKWNPNLYGTFHPEHSQNFEEVRNMLKNWYSSDAYMFGLSQRYPNIPRSVLTERYVNPLLQNLDTLRPYSVEGGTMRGDFRVKAQKANSITKEPPYWMPASGMYAPGTQYVFVPSVFAKEVHPVAMHEMVHGSDSGIGFGTQFLNNAAKDPTDLWHHNLNTEMRAYTVPAQAWIYQQTRLNPFKSWHWPKIQSFLDSYNGYNPYKQLINNYNGDAVRYQLIHGLQNGGTIKNDYSTGYMWPPKEAQETPEEDVYIPTIDDLVNFTAGYETFTATPINSLNSDGTTQVLAGYGSSNPEIIALADQGKLTQEMAKAELKRHLLKEIRDWKNQLPEYKNLSMDIQLALADISYNGYGVTNTIKNSPKLIAVIKKDPTDIQSIAKQMDHSKNAGGWLGVRSAARRAMALGQYDWRSKDVDIYGRQIDPTKPSSSKDWTRSPYYGKN